jgi:hypothetical protein
MLTQLRRVKLPSIPKLGATDIIEQRLRHFKGEECDEYHRDKRISGAA